MEAFIRSLHDSLVSASLSRGCAGLFRCRAYSLLFCAPLIVNGFAMPDFPVWLSTLSLSDAEIGIVLAVPMFVRVITAPLVGLLADRIGERARVLIWSAVLSLLTGLALFVSHSFWFVLVICALQGGVYSPYLPIVEAIALTGVRRWRFDYASMRLWDIRRLHRRNDGRRRNGRCLWRRDGAAGHGRRLSSDDPLDADRPACRPPAASIDADDIDRAAAQSVAQTRPCNCFWSA